MADKSGNQIIEIRAGTSQQQLLELVPGTPVQPMSVGRMGTWPIDAPGVLDAHAYLYFDGRALFVQSADTSNPVKGNGQAIGTAWQQIEIPCTLELGKARLVYRMLEEADADGDEDKTIAQAIKVPDASAPQFRPGQGMFSNRNQPPDSDATRIQQMPAAPPPPGREPDPTVVSPLEAGTPAAGVPKMRPAAGMPAPPRMGPAAGAPAPPPPTPGYQGYGSVQVAMAQPMNQTLNAPVQSPLAGQPQAPPAYGMPLNMMPPNMMPAGNNGPGMMMPNMMPAGAGPHAETGRIQTPPEANSPLQKALAEWKAMPPIRKIILGSFPGVAILGYMLVTDPGPQRPMQQQQMQQQTTQQVVTPPSVTTAPVQTPPIPTPLYTPPTVTTTYVAPPPSTSVTAPPTTSASALPPPAKGRTLERQAIDLAMQGQYTKAAEIYDQLAAQHPEQPAYKEAARLLRLRQSGQ